MRVVPVRPLSPLVQPRLDHLLVVAVRVLEVESVREPEEGLAVLGGRERDEGQLLLPEPVLARDSLAL
eukprot:473636-Lingulodinium_polyedra.AAC.1